jgi:hypothetical protein
VWLPDLPVSEMTEIPCWWGTGGGADRDRQRASGQDDGTDDPAPVPAGARRDAAGTVEAAGPGHQRGARRRDDRAHAAGPAGLPGHAGTVRTAADRRGHGQAGRAGLHHCRGKPAAWHGRARRGCDRCQAGTGRPGRRRIEGADSYAVQLLAARGAAVVATGAADDAARLTGLGAAAVADYTAGTWPASRARTCWPSPVTDGRVT